VRQDLSTIAGDFKGAREGEYFTLSDPIWVGIAWGLKPKKLIFLYHFIPDFNGL
jgi:hypothetical protein